MSTSRQITEGKKGPTEAVLDCLRGRGGLTSPQIAAATGLSRRIVASTVNRLVREGSVEGFGPLRARTYAIKVDAVAIPCELATVWRGVPEAIALAKEMRA